MATIKRFKIPVNPMYNTELDAADQDEQYVNPVTLANEVIRQANEAVEITDVIIANKRKLAQAKVSAKAAQYALVAFEAGLLRKYPAPPGDRKSNKLLEIYIRATAEQVGSTTEYEALRLTCDELEALIIILDAEVESGWAAVNLLRTMGEHIQTHLSFQKHELSNMR